MKIEELAGAATPLRNEDLRATAARLKVSVAHVQTVRQVESSGVGFDPSTRRPIILFEPHIFHRRTSGKFDKDFPDISYPERGALPYPKGQAERYAQLARAMALDEVAALESASWGMFQIMGFNAKPAGYATVQGFARAMARSEGEQLSAFAMFIASQPAMLDALRGSDWAGFARIYNGPGYAKGGYDKKLQAAFQRFKAAA